MAREPVLQVTREAVASAMGLEVSEVAATATLFGNLGVESIDILDILFRVDRVLGTKTDASDLDAYMQGGIRDDDFASDDDFITDEGLTYLKSIMPQIDVEEQRGRLKANDVLSLFSVENLADMLKKQAGVAAG